MKPNTATLHELPSPLIFPECQSTLTSVPSTPFFAFFLQLGGQGSVRRREKDPGALPLRVTNFTLCWEKSAEALHFPGGRAPLPNTERLIQLEASVSLEHSRHGHLLRPQVTTRGRLKLAHKIPRTWRGRRRPNKAFHRWNRITYTF